MSTQAPIVPSEGTSKKISFFAIGSTLTGALSYLLIFFHNLIDMGFLWAAILAPISALIAIITGIKGKSEIRKADGNMSGKKLANAGLAMGYIYIGICILIVVLLIVGVAGIADYVNNAL